MRLLLALFVIALAAALGWYLGTRPVDPAAPPGQRQDDRGPAPLIERIPGVGHGSAPAGTDATGAEDAAVPPGDAGADPVDPFAVLAGRARDQRLALDGSGLEPFTLPASLPRRGQLTWRHGAAWQGELQQRELSACIVARDAERFELTEIVTSGARIDGPVVVAFNDGLLGVQEGGEDLDPVLRSQLIEAVRQASFLHRYLPGQQVAGASGAEIAGEVRTVGRLDDGSLILALGTLVDGQGRYPAEDGLLDELRLVGGPEALQEIVRLTAAPLPDGGWQVRELRLRFR